MNEFIATLYDRLFDWNVYEDLSRMVFENLDYGKIGWILIVLPILFLIIFYKLWDPVSSSKLKWYLTMFLISLISYIGASTILYSNTQIIEYIGNFTGEDGQVNADYFIFQMSMITFFYALIISFILSIVPFRLISTNNRHNPF